MAQPPLATSAATARASIAPGACRYARGPQLARCAVLSLPALAVAAAGHSKPLVLILAQAMLVPALLELGRLLTGRPAVMWTPHALYVDGLIGYRGLPWRRIVHLGETTLPRHALIARLRHGSGRLLVITGQGKVIDGAPVNRLLVPLDRLAPAEAATLIGTLAAALGAAAMPPPMPGKAPAAPQRPAIFDMEALLRRYRGEEPLPAPDEPPSK